MIFPGPRLALTLGNPVVEGAAATTGPGIPK